MIGCIRGVLLEKKPPLLLVDIHGLGYEILAPMSVFYTLPEIGTELCLYTHFVVREDIQLLYGFHSKSERELFRALIKVNGVGPKMALAILSGMDSSAFARCILDGNKAQLVNLPGVGKKTAERLIVEMGDRLKEWSQLYGDNKVCKVTGSVTNGRQTAIDDAVHALIALGYKQKDALKAVGQPDIEEVEVNSELLIRRALQKMSQ